MNFDCHTVLPLSLSTSTRCTLRDRIIPLLLVNIVLVLNNIILMQRYQVLARIMSQITYYLGKPGISRAAA